MAITCAEPVRLHNETLGGVAESLGGTLVLPPMNVQDVHRCFEEAKHVPKIQKNDERHKSAQYRCW